MKQYTAIIERCPDTGLLVGHSPGIHGAYTQGETMEELRANLLEVLELLREEGELEPEAGFVGMETLTLA